MLEYAYDLAAEKDLGMIMWADHTLGLVDTAEANYVDARAHLGKSLTQAMLLGNLRPRLRALEGFAVLAAADGQHETALTLIAAMDEVRAQIDLPRARTEEAMIDKAIRSSEGALSRAAQKRGGTPARKTLEQATEFAREISRPRIALICPTNWDRLQIPRARGRLARQVVLVPYGPDAEADPGAFDADSFAGSAH